MSPRGVTALLAASSLVIALAAWRVAGDSGAAASGAGAPGVDITFQVDGALDRAELLELAPGLYQFLIEHSDGTTQRLTPDEFAHRIHERQTSRDWLSLLFNISSPIGILWVSLGLLGQFLFTARMLVQWLASEKHKRSIVPPAFWWLSLLGASMLLAYFIWRRDIVGTIGQSFGWIVYLRNIHLIYFGHGRVIATNDPAPQPALDQPHMTSLDDTKNDTR